MVVAAPAQRPSSCTYVKTSLAGQRRRLLDAGGNRVRFALGMDSVVGQRCRMALNVEVR